MFNITVCVQNPKWIWDYFPPMYLCWLILVVSWWHLESTNTQAANHPCKVLLIRRGKAHPDLGQALRWQPTRKDMGEERVLVLSACPYSQWQVCLSCCSGQYSSTSSGFQSISENPPRLQHQMGRHIQPHRLNKYHTLRLSVMRQPLLDYQTLSHKLVK